MNTLEKEREKYDAVWAIPDYSTFSPGGFYSGVFAEYEPYMDAKIIDLGCGGGAGGKALRNLGYQNVEFLDIVDVCKEDNFINMPIWKDWASTRLFKRDWGYCCDVMEHLPESLVGLAVHQMSRGCHKAFLSISLTEDAFGRVICDDLHLTVKPYAWWKSLLSEFGTVIEARDQMDTGVYVVEFGI